MSAFEGEFGSDRKASRGEGHKCPVSCSQCAKINWETNTSKHNKDILYLLLQQFHPVTDNIRLL